MKTMKLLLSRKCLKCLMEGKMARSSLSKAEYFFSAGARVLEKKAIGRQCWSRPLWASSAPTATSDASK